MALAALGFNTDATLCLAASKLLDACSATGAAKRKLMDEAAGLIGHPVSKASAPTVRKTRKPVVRKPRKVPVNVEVKKPERKKKAPVKRKTSVKKTAAKSA